MRQRARLANDERRTTYDERLLNPGLRTAAPQAPSLIMHTPIMHKNIHGHNLSFFPCESTRFALFRCLTELPYLFDTRQCINEVKQSCDIFYTLL